MAVGGWLPGFAVGKLWNGDGHRFAHVPVGIPRKPRRGRPIESRLIVCIVAIVAPLRGAFGGGMGCRIRGLHPRIRSVAPSGLVSQVTDHPFTSSQFHIFSHSHLHSFTSSQFTAPPSFHHQFLVGVAVVGADAEHVGAFREGGDVKGGGHAVGLVAHGKLAVEAPDLHDADAERRNDSDRR